MNKLMISAAVAAIALSNAQSAHALSVVGWVACRINCDAGRAIDRAHDQIKQQVPVYRQVEEGGSRIVQRGFEELGGEVGGPALSEWIFASKRNALNAGTMPIPPQMRMQLAGYFSELILNSVRFRVGVGNEFALAANAFRNGAIAITLDDVIVFQNWPDAQNNVHLWAHELAHVEQYKTWGVLDFAKRYVKDVDGVERGADARASGWVSWRQSQAAPMQPGPQFPAFGPAPQQVYYPPQQAGPWWPVQQQYPPQPWGCYAGYTCR